MIKVSSLFTLSAALLLVTGALCVAQDSPTEPTIKQRVYKLATNTGGPDTDRIANHPLLPVLKYAYGRVDVLDAEIKTFSCTLIKRESVKGTVTDYQYMDLRVKNRQVLDNGDVTPLSVYAQFQAPSSMKGREVLYVEGQNDGKILARRGGSRLAFITTSIDPTGPLAMRDNRYPITEVGFRNLMGRLIERAEADLRFDECKVEYFKGAKIEGRNCTHIVVTHPIARDHFTFHRADIFIDKEFNVPVRYVSYGWPEAGELPLLEEYTYTNVRLNTEFSENEFDPDNPEYGFYTRDDEKK